MTDDEFEFYYDWPRNWTFDDYIDQLKWHISLYKTASPGTGYLKEKIKELNDEVWEFFPQECTEMCGAYHPNNYLNFFDDLQSN